MAEQIGSERDVARALAGRSVVEMRAAYERSLTLGQDVVASWETLIVQGLMSLREIGDRLGRNCDANIRATFDFAETYLQALSTSEMCELQRRFLDEQSERLAGQVKDMETLVSVQIRAINDEMARKPRG